MKSGIKFGEYLIEKKIITTSQLEEALKKSKELSLPLGETLIRLKHVSEHLMLETLSKLLGIDFVNIAENNYQAIDKSLSKALPLEVCQQHKVIPVFMIKDEDTKELTLAMADPFDEEALRQVEDITECHVTPVLSTRASIETGIGKMYSVKMDVKVDRVAIEKGDAIAIANNILQKAVGLGASDIHIEPHAKEVHVRMRIDGVLEIAAIYPSNLHSSIVSRIKIMASEQSSLMKIEERRLPQDGSFTRQISGHRVDCRVSTLPAIFGEKVVMRLFDKDKATFVGRIKDLKMSPRMELQFRRCVRVPSGINVVTGPTGSGKTTTLHAVVNEINTPGINIMTVEDPVEYQAPDYINQSSVMPQAGYTYGRALRAIMRQDPDIILIGEVRDLETAEIAVQAALTGHRVFTTLHTEDAAGSIARLVDIGVENFLVSATVTSTINQRLIRKVCQNCVEEYVPTLVEMKDIGMDNDIAEEIQRDYQKYNLRSGPGCQHCRQTGYRGRQAVFELITMTPEIREIIHQKKGSVEIMNAAREKGKVNLIFEEGIRLFLSGVTSLGELQHLPRGDYKVKSAVDIFKDSQIQ
ncbi:MAG: GspE/PulE family protein [Thermodesulfovibrionales bacterium]|nr:GspE/PulE family protein [Thermodesulfovibrionales bacterium]